jgi:hypothetical protein
VFFAYGFIMAYKALNLPIFGFSIDIYYNVILTMISYQQVNVVSSALVKRQPFVEILVMN